MSRRTGTRTWHQHCPNAFMSLPSVTGSMVTWQHSDRVFGRLLMKHVRYVQNESLMETNNKGSCSFSSQSHETSRCSHPVGLFKLMEAQELLRLKFCSSILSEHESVPAEPELHVPGHDGPHAPLLSDDVQIEKQCFPQKGRNKFMYDLCRIYKKEQIIKNLSLRHFTKFIKFLLWQQLTKLRDFLRESGVVLSLLVSLLSLT